MPLRWQKKYEALTKHSMRNVIAHYYCELAEVSLLQKKLSDAMYAIKEALKVDKHCVRGSLLAAKIYIDQADYQSALTNLKQVKKQNPSYLSEAIELLASCYEKLNAEEDLVIYLKKLLDEYPHVPVVLILAERIRAWKGDKVAAGFVADYLRRYPSLRGLYLFVNIYISNAEGRAKEDLHILQNLMKKLLADKPDYQCKHCGFAGTFLHWQCPGCKRWSTMLPVYTLEGVVS